MPSKANPVARALKAIIALFRRAGMGASVPQPMNVAAPQTRLRVTVPLLPKPSPTEGTLPVSRPQAAAGNSAKTGDSGTPPTLRKPPPATTDSEFQLVRSQSSGGGRGGSRSVLLLSDDEFKRWKKTEDAERLRQEEAERKSAESRQRIDEHSQTAFILRQLGEDGEATLAEIRRQMAEHRNERPRTVVPLRQLGEGSDADILAEIRRRMDEQRQLPRGRGLDRER
jgi:hypothetical protein